MRINFENIAGKDVEWYGVDLEGRVARFFTGGCCLIPETLMVSLEDLEVLVDFFENFEEQSEVVVKDIDFLHYNIGINSIKKDDIENGFLIEFIDISKKGIFSFDGNTWKDNSEYFKLTSPTKPLRIDDLPDEIQKIIRCFKLNCVFEDSEILVMREDGVRL